MASTGERLRVRVMAALLVGMLLALGLPRLADALAPPRTAESALASLTNSDLREPDTVALALRAAVRLGDRDRVGGLARRLMRLALHPQSGQVGWGLSYAFDDFADGTVNPASTVYVYTTSLAASALLDAYEITGDTRWRRIAVVAADTILDRACCYGGDAALWYSDQTADHQPGLVTPNIQGLAVALFYRLPQHRFHRAAAPLVDELLSSRKGMNWRYRYGAPEENDLLHLAFIIDGLAAAPRTRPLGRRIVAAALERYYDGSTPKDDPRVWGTKGWGPAAFFVSMRDLGEPVDGLRATLADELSAWPALLKDEPRARAWYAYALADQARP